MSGFKTDSEVSKHQQNAAGQIPQVPRVSITMSSDRSCLKDDMSSSYKVTKWVPGFDQTGTGFFANLICDDILIFFPKSLNIIRPAPFPDCIYYITFSGNMFIILFRSQIFELSTTCRLFMPTGCTAGPPPASQWAAPPPRGPGRRREPSSPAVSGASDGSLFRKPIEISMINHSRWNWLIFERSMKIGQLIIIES